MLSETGKILAGLPIANHLVDRIKALQPGAIYVPGYALDHPIHTTPNVYFQNRLRALLLWIDYTVEWKFFQHKLEERVKESFKIYHETGIYAISDGTGSFVWRSGERYEISITTTFTGTGQDQPMCFEEFCMWIAMQYHFQIAL